ncbi:MAG: site-2 protease family protein [Clostridia bacterium]|nr:site-2 protease family protein [Clostridia bacterium]MBQ9919655.1 site-2 protease family protein [Clostridia bacterium]
MLINVLRNSPISIYDLVSTLFASLIVVFVCIPFREFICAWVATKLGDYTPRYNGRLTINPLAHIDPIGAIMMVLFGFGFGKGVPYNPYNFKKPRQGVLIISLAGPLSLLVFGFFFYVICEIVGYFFALQTEFGAFLTEALYLISYLNVGLAVFYLIPIPPLDGGRILFHFLPDRITYSIRSYERYFPFVLMVLIFSGALDYPLLYARMFFMNLFNIITFWI